ncbi:MAG: sulfotransferase [Paracoccaceae bacterium]
MKPDTRARLTQAQSLLQAGRPDAALAQLLPAMRDCANDPGALDVAAMCYWRLGDGATALAMMAVITDGWPGISAAWSKRAAMAASMGDRDLATSCLQRALALEPRSVPVLAALNRISPFSRNGAMTRRLRDLVQGKGISGADRVMALNALGRIEERAGRHKIAFRRFAASKAAARVTYPTEEVELRLKALEDRAAPLATSGGPTLVFIAGMPRSGTTLVESILERHPRVTSAGESRALTHALTQARAAGWPSQRTEEAAETLRDVYLQALGLPPGEADRVVLDKMPLNIFELDFARWILPEARFVFLQRHPLDVGLSCFCTNFFEGNAFSHQLEWIGHMTRAVYAAADIQEQRLGATFRRQSYRALVERPEAEIRGLLEHVGLPYHADCLSPEAGQGPTRTASMYQVREKINRGALGKWTAYERELAPLVAALGDDWIEGWDALDARPEGVAA